MSSDLCPQAGRQLSLGRRGRKVEFSEAGSAGVQPSWRITPGAASCTGLLEHSPAWAPGFPVCAGCTPATPPFPGLLHSSFLHPSLVHIASEITPILDGRVGIYYDSNSPDSYPHDSKVRSPPGKRGNHVHLDQCYRPLPDPEWAVLLRPMVGALPSPLNTGALPTFYLQTSPQACSSRPNTSLLGFLLCVFQGVFNSARGALKLASPASKEMKYSGITRQDKVIRKTHGHKWAQPN